MNLIKRIERKMLLLLVEKFRKTLNLIKRIESTYILKRIIYDYEKNLIKRIERKFGIS